VRIAGSLVVGVALTNATYHLPRVSATFHGRDIFAPVAAHLSNGVPLAALGLPIDEIVVNPTPEVERRDGTIVGQVRHVDRFGNVITDIGRADLAGLVHPVFEFADQRIGRLSNHYAQATGLLALFGSSDRLEIALNGGNAAAVFGLKVGDRVVAREGE
jgi:S-adenosylmethionine hydrolase